LLPLRLQPLLAPDESGVSTVEYSNVTTMRVSDDRPGSTFHLTADLNGGLLNGPLGRLVARIITSDVRKSVNNLASLE